MTNQTLKTSAHSGFLPEYAEWQVQAGVAAIGNLKTLDNQLAGRLIIPSRPYYVGFLAARADKHVRFPDTAFLYAGFWLNNAGTSYWIQGANPFALSASVNGSPTSTIDRKYRIFARTDRATSFLSTEVDVPLAPTDAAFNAGASVSLAWSRLADVGILSYDVYRKTGSTFELLEQVSSGGNTYLDNNVVLSTATGYPTATDDRSTSLTTTKLGVLNGVAIDGTSPQWSTFSFPVRVAGDFNSSLGDQQWLRLGLGGLPNGTADIRVMGATIGGNTVSTTEDVFTADMVGKGVQLTDANGVITSNSVASYTSPKIINLTTGVANGTYTVLILGAAGNHSLLIDCVHISPADGAVFAPNDQDLTPPRPQFPRAAPHFANQGGGTGGEPTNGGEPMCTFEMERLSVWSGNERIEKLAKDVKIGEAVESGNVRPNIIVDCETGFCDSLWKIESENGCSLEASPSHLVYRTRLDVSGERLDRLTVGEAVLTSINGAIISSKISRLYDTGRPGKIVKLTCSPTPSFVAGTGPVPFSGFLNHNRKSDDDLILN